MLLFFQISAMYLYIDVTFSPGSYYFIPQWFPWGNRKEIGYIPWFDSFAIRLCSIFKLQGILWNIFWKHHFYSFKTNICNSNYTKPFIVIKDFFLPPGIAYTVYVCLLWRHCKGTMTDVIKINLPVGAHFYIHQPIWVSLLGWFSLGNSICHLLNAASVHGVPTACVL